MHNHGLVPGNVRASGAPAHALCFLQGTQILTPTGPVPVESLRPGTLLVTRFGGIRPVKWIGRQSFRRSSLQADATALPVTIAAGALGAAMPARDLTVSPGHLLLLEGVLVPAGTLRNGVTIAQGDGPEDIQYYQIDFGSHDCVIAEGVWAGTYADAPGRRDLFHNADDFATRFPNDREAEEEELCCPSPAQGAKLAAAMRPVAERAAAGLEPGPLRGSVDVVTAWRVEGWAQDELYPELPVLLEVSLEGKPLGTVLACDHRADLKLAGMGSGRHSYHFFSPVRLQPEVMDRVTVRRAKDAAPLTMSAACAEAIAALQEPWL